MSGCGRGRGWQRDGGGGLGVCGGWGGSRMGWWVSVGVAIIVVGVAKECLLYFQANSASPAHSVPSPWLQHLLHPANWGPLCDCQSVRGNHCGGLQDGRCLRARPGRPHSPLPGRYSAASAFPDHWSCWGNAKHWRDEQHISNPARYGRGMSLW